jgi:hypothetical protein
VAPDPVDDAAARDAEVVPADEQPGVGVVERPERVDEVLDALLLDQPPQEADVEAAAVAEGRPPGAARQAGRGGSRPSSGG